MQSLREAYADCKGSHRCSKKKAQLKWLRHVWKQEPLLTSPKLIRGENWHGTQTDECLYLIDSPWYFSKAAAWQSAKTEECTVEVHKNLASNKHLIAMKLLIILQRSDRDLGRDIF